MATDSFTPEEQKTIARWEQHMRLEFEIRDPVATVATMSSDNNVNHVPVMTGGRGREEMLEFYGEHFIPKVPADLKFQSVCRTVGQNRVVDEIVVDFTHDIEMDWMLPGVAPTHRRVEIALVVSVETDAEGKIRSERIYWDQASVLVQIGLIDPSRLPVVGAESARKVLAPTLSANGLIRAALGR